MTVSMQFDECENDALAGHPGPNFVDFGWLRPRDALRFGHG